MSITLNLQPNEFSSQTNNFKEKILSSMIETSLYKKKYKAAVEADRFAIKQMGLLKSEEKRKKMTSDRSKRVNINKNAIPTIWGGVK